MALAAVSEGPRVQVGIKQAKARAKQVAQAQFQVELEYFFFSRTGSSNVVRKLDSSACCFSNQVTDSL